MWLLLQLNLMECSSALVLLDVNWSKSDKGLFLSWLVMLHVVECSMGLERDKED